MSGDAAKIQTENARLKKDLEDAQQKRDQEVQQYEQRIEKERAVGKAYSDQIDQKTQELNSMRNKMVKLTRQLDEEVTRRDIAQADAVTLSSKVQDMSDGAAVASPSSSPPGRGKGISFEKDRDDHQGKSTAQSSTKLMRVVEHWISHKDLQQAMLRGAGLNDMSFSTLVQVLAECPSLQQLDLAQNLLTMDSCSEICNIITSAPSISFISMADNLFSMRCLGYFMTAVMERQNTKKLQPLDLLDLSGNEGIQAAAMAPAPEALLQQVKTALGPTKLPPRGAELIAQVMKTLWRFLHDTGHPQVRNANVDEVDFQILDKSTVRKMESALSRILLLTEESGDSYEASGVRSVTADLVFLTLTDDDLKPDMQGTGGEVHATRELQMDASGRAPGAGYGGQKLRSVQQDTQGSAYAPELRDPFSDLKAAFEPPKEKLKTFNLKQIVTKNGTVLMNMLERLLDTTEIDANDVETEQTLLEFACQTGNISLAKLCYRRGANLAARSKKGGTALNIVTKSKRYDMMEFLHTYGVKVNSSDADGHTALHIAAGNNDVDAICRLIEWGADVNIRDNMRRTAIHHAASKGNEEVTYLLLELGAELNAKDAKDYTPAYCAEAGNHFDLMERLEKLGGKNPFTKGSASTNTKPKPLGDINVSPQTLKSSSLGRIGKVKVQGLPEPLRATLAK